MTLTPERVSEIAHEAYRRMGYETFRFGDGSIGVLKCPTKTVELMNLFQMLLIEEVDPSEPLVEDPSQPLGMGTETAPSEEPELPDGWDVGRHSKTRARRYHWYKGASPLCGSDAPLSLAVNRRPDLPNVTSFPVCKRCKAIMR